MPSHSGYVELYIGVPFDPRYEHTALFKTPAEQRAYFLDRRNRGIENCSYLRKEQQIIVYMNVEDMEDLDISYCGMINDQQKWRYYFITNKEYIADDRTRLTLELDVMQTYQFDWELPACFIERSHVVDDTPGHNLLDEGLEVGEYLTTVHHSLPDLADPDNWCILIQSTIGLNPTDSYWLNTVRGHALNNAYTGVGVYAYNFKGTIHPDDSTTFISILNGHLSALEAEGKLDGVINMWMYPKSMVLCEPDEFGNSTFPNLGGKVYGTQKQKIVRTARSTLDGYTPRNNKLWCYPYSFIYVHNNAGESAVYHYEKFSSQIIEFEYQGAITPDSPVKIYPLNYRGMGADYESGLTLQGYPTCAWNSDLYKIWLAQNQHTQALTMQSANIQAAVGAGQALIGAVTLNGGSAAAGVQTMYSAYEKAAGLVAQRKDMDIQPPQSKGNYNTSVNASAGCMTFTLADMCIDRYHAAMIDEFFDMYGYKINRVQVPNLKVRKHWNYIKTVGCVVKGGIDAKDRRRIADIFDRGITIWHDPRNMYAYTTLRNENTQQYPAE